MIYAVSDLHGYPIKKFKELLEKINFSRNDFLYVLGDVIDRGSDGVALLEWMTFQPNVQLILGNHEAMLLANDFLFEEITEDSIDRLTANQIKFFSHWMNNSGKITLDALYKIDKSDRTFLIEYLREAPLFEALTVNGRDFILTHSGLGNFSAEKKLSDYSALELLWTRPDPTDRYYDDIITVFGHTPTVYFGEKHKGKAFKTETWIDIDAGAGMGITPMFLRLDDMQEFYF